MSSTPSQSPNNAYITLDPIRHPEGVTAILTQRVKDGTITFSLVKEYDLNGSTQKTPFFGRRHIPAIRQVLNDLADRLEAQEDRTRAAKR